MEARNETLSHFLSKPQQFTIPIYQRRYSWTKKQCQDLFNDIIKIGKSEDDKENHFLGSIVYLGGEGLIPTYMVVDGQQRLTTINLLISALAKFLVENSIDIEISNAKRLVRYYLINSEEEGDLVHKLVLGVDDNKTLQKIVDNALSEDKLTFESDDSSLLVENYKYFKSQINETNVKIIVKGISRLLIIAISLKEGIDNPQLIFESLNATGLSLNQADLIRNYILMGLNPIDQERLYNDYWHKIELSFEDKGKNVFDLFIRDYLTVEQREVPHLSNDDIYIKFKQYSEYFETEELIKKIYKYSKYYLKSAFNMEEDVQLNKAFISLNKLEYKVVRPFLLDLYKDYDEGLLNKEEFIEILNLTESYLLRRFICGFGSNSLNHIFPKIYKEIMATQEEFGLNYIDSYKRVLLLKEGNSKMPTNLEFKENFIMNSKYKHRYYMLGKFENWNHKEKIRPEDYTIEHIMPQTLSEEWKESLGPNFDIIHKTYLHTLGNLTLTGCNPEMGNKSFSEKKTMDCGYNESVLRLNKYLQNVDKWDESEIKRRAEHLVNQAFEIWEYPKKTDNLKLNVDKEDTIQTKL